MDWKIFLRLEDKQVSVPKGAPNMTPKGALEGAPTELITNSLEGEGVIENDKHSILFSSG